MGTAGTSEDEAVCSKKNAADDPLHNSGKSFV